MFARLLPLALLASAAFAQTAPDASQPQFGSSVSVGYVMIPFTVLGSKGIPLTDLRENEVQVLVDGQQVRSDLFEKSQNAPVSFTILVDGSGSMALAGKMEAARAAVASILAQREPGDDFALYVFAESEAREVVPFTDDVNQIYRAINSLKPWGKTAFFDALANMPERSRLGRNPTRAIILLSDGIDNASQLTREQLALQLQGISVPIYSLGLIDKLSRPKLDPTHPREELSDIDLLDQVASLTGGRLYVGNEPEEIAAAVSNLEKNLRAQYLLGFTPTGKGAVKYRHISLQLAGRVRSVRVRAGYLGTEPPVLNTVATTGRQKRNERKGS